MCYILNFPHLFPSTVFCRAHLFMQLPDKGCNKSWRGCWRRLCLALLWVAPPWQWRIYTALFRTIMCYCGAWSHMPTPYHLLSFVNFLWRRTMLSVRSQRRFPPHLCSCGILQILKLIVLSIDLSPRSPIREVSFPKPLLCPTNFILGKQISKTIPISSQNSGTSFKTDTRSWVQRFLSLRDHGELAQ